MKKIYKTKELSKSCYSNLTEKERSQLLDLIIDNKFTSYLEVGVMRGGNLINMTNLLKLNNKKCEIVGYDCFELLKDCKPKYNTHTSGFPKKETVEKNVNLLHNCNVELIMGLSENINSVFRDRKFDLIFHDADHSYEGVYKDLIILKKILNKNGYICLHDANKCKAFGVHEAIEDICGQEYYEKIAMHGSIATLKPIW